MAIPILNWFAFAFNGGRGIRPNQVAWSEADTALDERIQGTALTDAQIPDSIMRDSEFTAAAIRGLLGLSADELNDLLTGATIAGQVLTFNAERRHHRSTSPSPRRWPGTGDGVVQSGAINASDRTELTLTLDNGGVVVIDHTRGPPQPCGA